MTSHGRLLPLGALAVLVGFLLPSHHLQAWPWSKDYGCKKGDFIVITLAGDSSKLAGKVLKVNDQGIKIRQIQLDFFSLMGLVFRALAEKEPSGEKIKIYLGGEYFIPWSNIAAHEPIEISRNYFVVVEP